MTQRHRLANRRAVETFAIEHDDLHYMISLGRERIDRERLGPVMEVFLNAEQVNSAADVLAIDGAILISLLLQHGCPIETINHALRRNPNGSPCSLLGRVAAVLNAEAGGS